MVASENILKLLHELSTTFSIYNLNISADKTKILSLKGKEFIRVKIMMNSNIMQ
jgi:hypothetical protein